MVASSWAEAVLAVLAKHAGTCAAFVAGHDHSGERHRTDRRGGGREGEGEEGEALRPSMLALCPSSLSLSPSLSRSLAANSDSNFRTGGYGRDPSTGIHHLTLRGVVETVPGDDAFATLTPFADGLFIRGYGREESR